MPNHLAQVYRVLPERHGVLVIFRDGTYSVDTERTFCRVLADRAHPRSGSSTGLPEVGEQGIVMELAGGFCVWLGSVHYQEKNQIEPEEGARVHRDSAGITSRSRGNGDTQWSHPSGLRITVSEDGQALPDLQRPGAAKEAKVPVVELEHPSGAKWTISKDGDISVIGPSGAKVDISKAGDMVIEDCASVKFQGGAKRFAMEDLFTWAKTHTHSGVMSGGSASGPPVVLPPDTSLSPSTFKGPAGG